jgi:hypothetical protein
MYPRTDPRWVALVCTRVVRIATRQDLLHLESRISDAGLAQ